MGTLHDLNLVRTESFAFLAVAAVCVLLLRRLQRLDACARFFAAVARRRHLALIVVFFAPLLLRVAILPVLPLHNPGGHDEFSYLLQADTFAHVRITNPTHPLWEHFESFHILQRPAYVSVYPVAQGLFLAAGQVIAHAPWLGVWISVALMCAALCWMLQGWLPPTWAFAGGLLAAIRLGPFNYWMNSYFGGAVCALAAALALGALPRLMRSGRTLHAIVFAVGLALLANSRPYEGMMLGAPIAVVFVMWLCGWLKPMRWLGLPPRRVNLRLATVRVVLPLLLILGSTGGVMAYYFQHVTGSPTKMPAMVEREQYGVAPAFIFQKLYPEPHFNHDVMKEFYTRTEPGYTTSAVGKFRLYWKFYLGLVLTVPFVMMWRVVPQRRTRFLLILLAWSVPTLAIERWANPHYFAPFVAPLYAVLLQSGRHLNVWLRTVRGRSSRWAALRWAIPLTIISMLGVRTVVAALGLSVPEWRPTWGSSVPANNVRAEMIGRLTRMGGRHLVIVRYAPGHNPAQEWVYNAADIDNSMIVWAREMDSARNAKLVDYFADRQIWLLDADHGCTLSVYRNQRAPQ